VNLIRRSGIICCYARKVTVLSGELSGAFRFRLSQRQLGLIARMVKAKALASSATPCQGLSVSFSDFTVEQPNQKDLHELTRSV
jgi:hypothetical protein